MQRELTKAEVERLFLGAVDDALDSSDAESFRQVLAGDAELKVRFEKYTGAVKALKELPREKAPASLASTILRRTKRRRSMFRSMAEHEASYRVPVEVIIPLLLAAVVAAFLLMAAR
ncbi:MAG: transmembrane transcriptional regulator [Myxococcales bacterium]|nr:transmembrane transcriptional regulator [Myxococcales bacterium]MDP3504526.1 transmembrane transcriptional regulator [Myxococcales bacterium]